VTTDLMAGDFALALLAVLVTLVTLGAAFTGIGLAARRAFGLRALTLDDCFLAFWVGVSVVLLFLILWNFLLPVGLTALLIVLAAGTVALIGSGRQLRGVFAQERWRPRAWEAVVLALGVLWVANHCMPAFNSWDGVLYHVQAVKWAKTFAVVPGLANLHGPLAFNNSSFLYDAMVDAGWWEGRGFHVANGALLLGAVVQALVSGLQLIRGGDLATSRRCFLFLTLAPALHMGRDVVSYSTDLPMGLMFLSAAALAYGLLDRAAGTPLGREDEYSPWALAVLLAGAVTIKLTAAIFAATALPLVLLVCFGRRMLHDRRRLLSIVAITLAVFATAWVARGIVLSGYPLFPMTVAGAPVEWRAPAEHAAAEAAYIAHTEREFTWKLIGRNWLRLIVIKDTNAALIPACLAVAGLAIWWRARRRIAPAPAGHSTWWLGVPLVIATGAWILTVPSHRYSPALFWSLAALCLAEGQRAASLAWGVRGRRWLAAGVVFIAVSPLVIEPALVALRSGKNPVVAIGRHNVIGPGAQAPLALLGGAVDTQVFETGTGLRLHVPARPTRPGPLPNACWNASLPCTPNPAANLELRVPGRLDKGFRVTGRWEMLEWPYYWQSYFLPEWRLRRSAASRDR